MHTGKSFVGFCLFAATCGWVLVGADAPAKQPPEPAELFAAGNAAYQRSQYAAAIGYMGQYLDARSASVNDPRVAEAQKIFVDSAMKIATQQERNHYEAAAANFLMEEAGHVGVGDGADAMKAAAKKDLQQASAVALKKPDHELVLELAEMWARLFPDDPPIVEKDKLDQHRLAELAELNKLGRPDAALKALRQLKSDGITDDAISAAGVNPADLTIKYAQQLYDRGWYRQAAAVCEGLATDSTPTAAQTTESQRLIERALSMYMTVCEKFGNAKMIEEAAQLYAAENNPQHEMLKVRRFQTTADSFKGKDEPRPLVIPGKVAEGKGVWIDTGVGFKLDNELVIGNNKGNHGGQDKHADIDVAPGFVLDGGTLTVSLGSLNFKGTPDKPIILRGVNLQCELTASITATDTIFVDCSFHKTGRFYWSGGYSSEWEFTDCIVAHSQYGGLTRVDYGIKWKDTIFVGCDLPDRQLNDDPAKDGTKEYHGDRNTITDCFFYDCNMAPSVLWGGVPTICYNCDVSGNSHFISSTPLTVPVALAPGDRSFLSRLMFATTSGGSGSLEYTTGAPPKTKPSSLWRLLPDIAGTTPAAQ